MEEKTKNLGGGGQKNILSLFSYLGVLCLIPILIKERDEFVKFHAKQGLVLFIAEIITWAFFSVAHFLYLLGNLFWLLWVVLSIIGIINVMNGQKKELPWIGKLARNFKF